MRRHRASLAALRRPRCACPATPLSLRSRPSGAASRQLPPSGALTGEAALAQRSRWVQWVGCLRQHRVRNPVPPQSQLGQRIGHPALIVSRRTNANTGFAATALTAIYLSFKGHLPASKSVGNGWCIQVLVASSRSVLTHPHTCCASCNSPTATRAAPTATHAARSLLSVTATSAPTSATAPTALP